MSKYFGRKRVVGVISTIAVLGIAAGAYAYFSTTGAGTANATVGTSSVLTIHGATSGALYPGTTTAVTLTVSPFGPVCTSALKMTLSPPGFSLSRTISIFMPRAFRPSQKFTSASALAAAPLACTSAGGVEL